MVENKKEKSNTCGRMITQVEWLGWEHLDVKDIFDPKGWLKYSWDSRGKDGGLNFGEIK
jgi:hypothetical protein